MMQELKLFINKVEEVIKSNIAFEEESIKQFFNYKVSITEILANISLKDME